LAPVLGGFEVGDGAKIGSNAVVTKPVPAGATAVGIPARIIESQEGVSADVSSPFNAYGITQQDDPLSQALHQLIEHAAQQERQIEQLRSALQKIAPEVCADIESQGEHLPVDQLNKMV
jgi:serine O-acetyltransferase